MTIQELRGGKDYSMFLIMKNDVLMNFIILG